MAKKGGPKSVPSTTSIIPSTTSSTLTSFFSKNQSFFAHLFRTLDSHTLRIYETETGKCITRWSGLVEEEGKEEVGCLEWIEIVPSAKEDGISGEGRGKKRRKDGGEEDLKSSTVVVENKVKLALGLKNGSILLITPNSNISPISISSPKSKLEIVKMCAIDGLNHVWTLSVDGSIRVWDLESQTLIGNVIGLNEGVKWDDLSVKYELLDRKYQVTILLSKLTIHLFTTTLSTTTKKDKIKEIKLVEVNKCSGYTSSCVTKFIHSLSSDSNSFLSYSKLDRFINFYSLQSNSIVLIARLGLSSNVSNLSYDVDSNLLSAVDSQGNISIITIPTTMTPSSKIIELPIVSSIINNENPILNLQLLTQNTLLISSGSLKPVFQTIEFKNETGYIKSIQLEKLKSNLLSLDSTTTTATPNLVRYSELSSSTVRTGTALADTNDSDIEIENNGELDVEMAEPTLAERLKSLKVGKINSLAVGTVDGEAEEVEEDDEDEEEGDEKTSRIPSTTLTTSLIQALHSSDTPLLESCLIHTNPQLIRATVKRLNSGTLVLNLLEVLVEKLGKGKSGKGVNGGSLASVKRARGLIEWVRQVLIVHVGFLVTIPSLVNRLSTLHSSLTSRLNLQPTLKSLNGRLELVLSQIELRQEKVAITASTTKRSALENGKGKFVGKRYVEGESSDSNDDSNDEHDDENEDGEIEFDSEEEGSIEDVILGSDQSDQDDAENDSEDDSDLEMEGGVERKGNKKINGRIGSDGLANLLDLEASDDDDSEEADSEENGEGVEGESDSDDEE